MKRILWMVMLCTAIVLAACNDDPFDPIAQLNKEIQAIDNYLAANNLSAVKDVTGIRMVISDTGTALPASVYANSAVEVEYSGTVFPNGAKFDEGTVDSELRSYIDGWQIAFSKLPAGSQAVIYIPSAYAYGNSPYGNIPASSTLVFTVNFKRVLPTNAQTSKFAADTAAIKDYLAANAINAKDSLGMHYVITQNGTGRTATYYDKVHLKYTFRLLSDPTKSTGPFEFKPTDEFYSLVADYLPGMTLGLQKMNEGSKATLYVPSLLAFASNQIQSPGEGQSGIPANSNLIVDIELYDILD